VEGLLFCICDFFVNFLMQPWPYEITTIDEKRIHPGIGTYVAVPDDLFRFLWQR